MSEDLIVIQNLIHEIRGKRVMLDFDLAKLYQVETKVLNQAVKRNIRRFPPDFMFQLTIEEVQNMRSQIVTTSRRRVSNPPFAFTEQGVAMTCRRTLGKILTIYIWQLVNWLHVWRIKKMNPKNVSGLIEHF